MKSIWRDFAHVVVRNLYVFKKGNMTMTKALHSRAAGIGLFALVLGNASCGSSGSSGNAGTGGQTSTGASSGSAGSGGSASNASSSGNAGSGGGSGTGGVVGTGGSVGAGGVSGAAGNAGGGGSGGDTAGAGGTASGGMGDGGASGSGGAGGGSVDAGAGSSGSDGGNADAAAGGGGIAITGSFTGMTPIPPLVTGLWIGKPKNPAESGGGPFVYLFTAGVTCQDISHGNGWLATIPKTVQGMEMIIGTTKEGMSVPVGTSGVNKAEANYFLAGSEHNSKSGTVTVTTYKLNTYVEGTLDVMFPFGSVKGTFHADWCPTGDEL